MPACYVKCSCCSWKTVSDPWVATPDAVYRLFFVQLRIYILYIHVHVHVIDGNALSQISGNIVLIIFYGTLLGIAAKVISGELCER